MMVNVFVPHTDLVEIAECLDTKRLYKQIVECKQILNALKAIRNNEKAGYTNHPATKMWIGHDKALRAYQLIMLNEWLERRWDTSFGYKELKHIIGEFDDYSPVWWGDENVHMSHRAMLFRKDSTHYASFRSSSEGWLSDTYEWVIE